MGALWAGWQQKALAVQSWASETNSRDMECFCDIFLFIIYIKCINKHIKHIKSSDMMRTKFIVKSRILIFVPTHGIFFLNKESTECDRQKKQNKKYCSETTVSNFCFYFFPSLNFSAFDFCWKRTRSKWSPHNKYKTFTTGNQLFFNYYACSGNQYKNKTFLPLHCTALSEGEKKTSGEKNLIP